MPTNASLKKDTYYMCRKCGDEIHWNTHKVFIRCKCGAIAVDGCEEYVRIIGSKEVWEKITK